MNARVQGTNADFEKLDARLVAVVLALLGIAHTGLLFEAWGWPAIDGYPTIERYLDPSYLSVDFYTNTSRGYGVDTVQAHLFGWLQRATGLPYDVSLALLNLLRCLTFPAVVYVFFWALSGRRSVALTGAMLGVASNFALPRTLGWEWVWGDASTAMFAIPAIVLGWTLLLRRRAAAVFLLFAFAAAMQPLVALHGAIVLGLIFLFDYRREELFACLRSPVVLAGAAVFGGVLLSQFVLLSPDPKDELPIAEYVNILAYERHPGDYLPSRFPADTVWAFLFAALAVGLVLVGRRAEIPRFRLVVATLGVYAALCLSGYLFVELEPVRLFVQLIPFRTASLAAPMMLYLLSCFAAGELERRRFAGFVVLLGLFVLASPYAERVAGPYDTIVKIGAPALLLAVVALALARPRSLTGVLDPTVGRLLAGPRLALGLSVALVLLGVAGARARPEAFTLPRLENQHPVYAWVESHTRPNSTFYLDEFSAEGAFLDAINPQKMRLVGRRAVVASLDFPFLDRDMRAWFERWKVALNRREPDRVNRADLATLEAVKRRFPFEYVVRRFPLPDDPKIRLEAKFHGQRGVRDLFVYRLL